MSDHDWKYDGRLANSLTPGSKMVFRCVKCKCFTIVERSKRWRDVPTNEEMERTNIEKNCDILIVQQIIEC